MRIAVYNRFLSTLGGGERYMAKIAQILAGHGEVEILSQTLVSPEVIRTRLGIDLGDIGFVHIPDHSAETVERMSEKYDLFINASHLDPVRSRAPASILLVHFPSATATGVKGFIRRVAFDRFVCRLLAVPALEGGFGPPEQHGDTVFRWTNGEGELRIPSLGERPPRVIVPLASFRHDGTGPVVRFLSGEDELAVVEVPPGAAFHTFPVTPTARRNGEFRLSIRSDSFLPPAELDDPRRLGVAVGSIRAAGPRGTAHRMLLEKLRPGLGESLYSRWSTRTPEYVLSYSSVWTVSRFVRDWTYRYWKARSSLINPPVDVEGIQATGQVPKENLILNVGRFFAGSHNKKHLEMLAAFRRMLDEGLSGWSLILVGGVAEGREHLEYLDRVRQAAADLPVRIAIEIPYQELLDLYSRASIYWHATGYGENERRHPAAMEHFGITTVEAMAGGCVPVVIRKAGQSEIVRHGKDGLLWRNLDELAENTWRLIRSPELLGRLADGARARSQVFSHAAFERRLLELTDALLPTPATD